MKTTRSFPLKRLSLVGLTALLFLSCDMVISASGQELPVGDGHVTDRPASGNVYACLTQFRGNGAIHTGSWFHGDTWDPTEKPHVEGYVLWDEAEFSIETRDDDQHVEGNGLPVRQPTGEFPISPDDPVYQYDRNPNSIEAQDLSFDIPLVPEHASDAGCLPMGMIGFTTTGVAIYNALDAAGRDAAAHEVQDLCDGHPQGQGQYHYHSASACVPGVDSNELVGWALDGYPILGLADSDGTLLTNEDLDACHGREETIEIDGRRYDYAYRLTKEYPYTLGCFTGKVQQTSVLSKRRSMGPRSGAD